MRQNGTLPGTDASQPDKIAEQITGCDGELKKFTENPQRQN